MLHCCIYNKYSIPNVDLCVIFCKQTSQQFFALKMYTISYSSTPFFALLSKDNVLNALVPKTFNLLWQWPTGQYSTAPNKKNPYNFKTYTTSFLGVTVNGEEVPFKPLQLSYMAANPRCVEAYLAMFFATVKLFYDTRNDISRDDFANSYALYAADLTPDMCGSFDHFNVVQRENLAVDIKYPLRQQML